VGVSDTGRGIPAEDIDKVFQPFFTTKLKNEGMGLGLFVGYGMIRRLGGNIKVISNQRKETAAENTSSGTTFTVELPILDMASTGHGLQEDKEGQA
jgi:signal transduction histidine kinase